MIGVYLPCQDLGMDLFHSCLTELEQLVCESRQLGPTVVLGDFNAHLGNLGGPKGNGNTNIQGLLHQHIVKSDLFVALLSEIAYGPSHIFQSGDTKTTIDYIMLDVCAASLLESCGTLEDNTSDHLPQSVQLEFLCKPNGAPFSGKTRNDWSSVESSPALNIYQSEISALVTPFLGRCHENIVCLNEELELIANNIKSLAEMTLQTIQPSKQRKKLHFFKDSTLKHLCERSKSVWREWCGAMPEGPNLAPYMRPKRIYVER